MNLHLTDFERIVLSLVCTGYVGLLLFLALFSSPESENEDR